MKLAQRTRRWLLPSGFFAAMLILTGVALADGNPSAAKSRVMGAKSLMESHRYDEVEDKLKEALDEAADDKEEIQFLKQALEDLIDAVESAAHDASSAMKENRRR